MGVGVTRIIKGESKRMQFKQRKRSAKAVRHHRGKAARRLRFESLEPRIVLSGIPLGSMQQDTGEFLLGSVTATVVLMESTGSASTENWDASLIAGVKAKVEEALTWWQDLLEAQQSVHSLTFEIDYQYADNPVETTLEPISERSNLYTTWVDEFLTQAGANTADGLSADMRKFNDSQRIAHDTNWGFTIFVVNDEQDADGMFAEGGSFRRAFAFSGGRYIVVPAGRPASTTAHEMGHIFWARDEYSGAGSYLQKRGYYNSQNLNAADNPGAGFVQQDSIMASGTLLSNAYTNLTSSDSSLKMLGWQDSDGDGVFDVLDVPHVLTGTGFVDPADGEFKFHGAARVGTLINANSSGFQSDMTINQLDRVEYRFDQGAWVLASSPGGYQSNLDIQFAVPAGVSQIELRSRSVDAITGLTVAESETLTFGVDQRTIAVESGIAGYVWVDADNSGSWDQGEAGLSEIDVSLVDSNGDSISLQTTADADGFIDSVVLNDRFSGLTLSAVGTHVVNSDIFSRQRNDSSTGDRVFANFNSATSSVASTWGTSTRTLKIDFDAPVSTVSIDAVADTNGDVGRLEVYSASGQLLDRYTTEVLSDSSVETMTLSRGAGDIAYAIARAHYDTELHLDHLVVGPSSTVTTDSLGVFQFGALVTGDYNVQMQGRNGWEASTPIQVARTVSSASAISDLQFGLVAPPWHHLSVPEDVDNNGHIVPLDALVIVNDLNNRGARSLPVPSLEESPPPFYDVSGDGWITSLDALQVINWLNANIAGESEGLDSYGGLEYLHPSTSTQPEKTQIVSELSVGDSDTGDPGVLTENQIEFQVIDDYYSKPQDYTLALWITGEEMENAESEPFELIDPESPK